MQNKILSHLFCKKLIFKTEDNVPGGGVSYKKKYEIFFASLKVVGIEKGGGSGEWLLFEDGFRPWRSMSVYCLMLPSSFLQRISVSSM